MKKQKPQKPPPVTVTIRPEWISVRALVRDAGEFFPLHIADTDHTTRIMPGNKDASFSVLMVDYLFVQRHGIEPADYDLIVEFERKHFGKVRPVVDGFDELDAELRDIAKLSMKRLPKESVLDAAGRLRGMSEAGFRDRYYRYKAWHDRLIEIEAELAKVDAAD